jgi:putative ABC transport system substrate-binding protein
MPRLTRVAVLWNPDTPWHTKAIEDLKAVAPSLSIALTFTKVQAPEQFGQALSAVNLAHAQALYVIDDPFFYVHRASVLSIASTLRLPCIYGVRGFVDEGGLMSYAPDYIDLLRRSAGYVDKILRGSKPGDLPIEQPTKFEFAINLRTAKTLGLTIPESILLRADEVIR